MEMSVEVIFIYAIYGNTDGESRFAIPFRIITKLRVILFKMIKNLSRFPNIC